MMPHYMGMLQAVPMTNLKNMARTRRLAYHRDRVCRIMSSHNSNI
jgi:hypothetical protein